MQVSSHMYHTGLGLEGSSELRSSKSDGVRVKVFALNLA